MKNLSNKTKIETAIQMVIMDEIENGHTDQSKLIDYMKTEMFQNAVLRYILMMNK